jgi:16S rRNA (guanine527-N7)-methyltransferase
MGFVSALELFPHRVIDLGAGGGVPGLVIATFRPDLHVTMVDRREKRTDFLKRAVLRLGIAERCEVWCCDVRDLVSGVHTDVSGRGAWDAVVSRGFGPPRYTVSLALGLVARHGRVVLSEPPAEQGDRWSASLLRELGVRKLEPAPPGVVILVPVSEADRS